MTLFDYLIFNQILYMSPTIFCTNVHDVELGVIISYYEVLSLGELWMLESLDKPRCHEDDPFMERTSIFMERTSIESIHM